MNRAAPLETKIHVGQGEFEVAATPDAVLTTILGSCVAACIWDPQARLGGMNHIVLPHTPEGDLRHASAGVNAMELLINGVIRAGGARERLQAKLFGGARMIAGLSDVGARNAEFAKSFLDREGIPCLSASLGGTQGRRVQFWPVTGRARQMLMESSDVPREEIVPPRVPDQPGNDLELF